MGDFDIINNALREYTGSEERILIPDTIKEIGVNSFCGNKTIKEVIVSEGVETIEGNDWSAAFKGCLNLQKITLPKSLKTIGDNAFESCESLEEIIIPEAVKKIGSFAFRRCNNLKKVTFLSNKASFGFGVFSECYELADETGNIIINNRFFGNDGDTRDLIIPEGVETVEKGALSGAKSVHFPDSVKRIEDSAFGWGWGDPESNIPKNYLQQDEKMSADITTRLLKTTSWKNAATEKDYVALVLFQSSKAILDEIKNRIPKEPATVMNYMVELLQEKGKAAHFQKAVDFYLENITEIDDVTLKKLHDVCLKAKNKKTVDLLKPYVEKVSNENKSGKNIEESGNKKKEISAEELEYFKDKIFVHTGLSNEETQKCEEEITKRGGIIKSSVVLATDVLIYNPDYGTITTKMKRADELNSQGHDIEIITTAEFFKKIAGENEPDLKYEGDISEIERFCEDHYAPHTMAQYLKKASISEKSISNIRYKDSERIAPSFVVECVVVPYIKQFEKKPKRISEYKKGTDENNYSLIEESDYIASSLNKSDLRNALFSLVDQTQATGRPEALSPFCRYASNSQIEWLLKEMKKWENWYSYGTSGRIAIIVARSCLILSDTAAAVSYLDKFGLLKKYSTLRCTDEDSVRDSLVSVDVDNDGKKFFKLGTTVVEATLEPDMKISLVDLSTKKNVKSFPKKNNDKALIEQANIDLKLLKKEIKTAVSNRKAALRSDFLTGRMRSATSWKNSYENNFILNRIARLIVWEEITGGNKIFFTLGEDGPIDAFGDKIVIDDNARICVAHPIEMTLHEIENWQMYFANNKLKQTFEQVWEPVMDISKVDFEERYKDAIFHMSTIRGLESAGWDITGEEYGSFRVSCNGISLSFYPKTRERIHSWKEIGKNTDIKLSGAYCYSSNERLINHTVFQLDRATLYYRISNDDVEIIYSIGSFTAAQINQLLKIAIESKSDKCVAALLDYKNRNYSDFYMIEEFTLED